MSQATVRIENDDWEASTFFTAPMTVRTVSIDFVPPKTGNSKQEAPAGDPVYSIIPEVAEYRVDVYKRVGTRSVLDTSYPVVARRTIGKSSRSEQPTIRLTYELPAVQVDNGSRLALMAPGKKNYPTPLRGGGSRFTMPYVNADPRGTVRLHDVAGGGSSVADTKVQVKQGAQVVTGSVKADGSYSVALNKPESVYEVSVVPPKGFATPASQTWDVAGAVDYPDFDLYPITVTGTVVDDRGTPVAGADVQVGGRSATTSSDGSFTVHKVPAGVHDIVVGETFSTLGTTVAGVAVQDQRENHKGTIRVPSKQITGAINGSVSGLAGGKTVTVQLRQGTSVVAEKKSQGNGSFSFPGVTAGDYTVEVSGEPADHTLKSAREQKVTIGNDGRASGAASFAFEQNTGAVNGSVSGLAGGKTVTVELLRGDNVVATKETQGNGSFSFPGVTAGDYTVKVSGAPADHSLKSAEAQKVTIGNDGRASGAASFAFEQNKGAVNGVVSGLAGGKTVTVELLRGDNVVATKETQGNGSFSFPGVTAGDYTVKVSGAPADHSLKSAEAQKVTIDNDGKASGSASFTYKQNKGAINGSVSGLAAGKVTVELRDAQDRAIGQQTVGNGSFSFADLTAGTYSLALTDQPNDHTVTTQPGELTVAEDGSVSGATAFVLQQNKGTVSGNVSGLITGTVTVELLDAQGGRIGDAKTQGNGSFSFPGVTAGDYTVEVSGAPADHALKSAREQKVTIGNDGKASGAASFTFEQNKGAVNGAVSGLADGKTVTVELRDANGTRVGDPKTVGNGSFSFPGVTAGDYTVVVPEVPGDYTMKPSGPVSVTMSEAGVPSARPAFTFALKDGSVSGSIVDGGGNPLPGTKVDLVDPNTREVVDTGTADENGEVDISGVRPGDYTVRVTPPAGYDRPKDSTVTVDPGQRATIPAIRVAKKPTPKPSTPKPSPTTTTPKPTTPKPTPTTSKPAPTTSTRTTERAPVSSTVTAVAWIDRDGNGQQDAGEGVSGVEISLRRAGETVGATARTNEDGNVLFEGMAPGKYTLQLTSPGDMRLVDPKDPENNSFVPGAVLETKEFELDGSDKVVELKLEAQRDEFTWDRVVVKPGETKAETPIRTGNVQHAPEFTTTSVSKVSDSGVTETLPDAENWITVEPDGTVVARPPRDTAPGEYRVEVADAAGETRTIVVEVSQPAPMSQRYRVAFPVIPVPAGASRQSGKPQATVADGPFTYDGALPAGSTFTPQLDWVTADSEGRLTFNPPLGLAPGIVKVPVVVSFPDGSTGIYTATVEVGDRMFADTVTLGYEEGLSVLPGESITVRRIGTEALPENTKFELADDVSFGGWTATVNQDTGDLRARAPKSGTAPGEFAVVAYFADGSTTELKARIRVSTSSALANKYSPSYEDLVVARGGAATAMVSGNLPEGTEFAVVDDGGLPKVGVDKQTGTLRIETTADAAAGETHRVVVRVRYPDGSTAEILVNVTATADAEAYVPEFTGSLARIGGAAVIKPTLPPGATADLADFEHPGWEVEYNPATGEISVAPDSSIAVGTTLEVPLRVTLPDGSTKVVRVPVTATGESAGEVATAKGSSDTGWIVVLLGAVAALAGVGYAAFLNQDAIKAQLAQFGIRL